MSRTKSILKPADRFSQMIDKYRDDPEYVVEGLLIDINEQIMQLLEGRNVSRSELAQTQDVSGAYITDLLNGNENLTIRELARLASALSCTVAIHFSPRSQQAHV